MVPTSTDVTIQLARTIPASAAAVAVFIHKQTKPKEAAAAAGGLSEPERKTLAGLMSAGVATGKSNEVTVQVGDPAASRPRRLVVIGLGNRDKFSAECLREGAATLAKAARKHKLETVALIVPPVPATLPGRPDATQGGPGREVAAEAITTGFLLGSFRYEEYKGTAHRKAGGKGDGKAGGKSDGKAEGGKDEDKPFRVSLTIVAEDDRALREAVDRGRAVGDGQNFARTIASRPGNDINPPTLAKVAQDLAREVGLGFRVLDEKQMARLGMGGILAVGSGSSATPPRLIVLEHRTRGSAGGAKGPGKKSSPAARGAAAAAPLLVVGKAITFDTGGISIKPAEKMGRMIFDKCGGMAVLGMMYAVAKLKLPVPVVGILSSAENHVSETAYRPGDILRMYNGVTVEVTNTDAEGRLVLGDALAWGIETYKPSAVVDLATLTGGVVVALGKTMAGVMSNSDALVAELNAAADLAGEKIWRLPLGEDQREYIKSEPADIVNSGGREGHPLQGGAFLSFFVPSDNSVPWAHLDIAGVADTEKELPYYAKGATGWGVRTLVEWVSSRDESRLRHATPRAAGG